MCLASDFGFGFTPGSVVLAVTAANSRRVQAPRSFCGKGSHCSAEARPIHRRRRPHRLGALGESGRAQQPLGTPARKERCMDGARDGEIHIACARHKVG